MGSLGKIGKIGKIGRIGKMSGSPQISIRFGAEVLSAIERAADGLDLSRAEFIRMTVENAVGVRSNLPRNGWEALTPDDRVKYGRRGGEAKAAARRSVR
jgi:hypothetical protein